MRLTLLNPLVALLALALPVVLHAADEDKERLFGSFYMEGERITYVLTLNENRTFELHGPDNSSVLGTLRASKEHLTLISGDVKRMFHFDNLGRNLKLGVREGDGPRRGNVLGEMPPTREGEGRVEFLNERNWLAKGRPLFKRPAVAAERVVPGAPAAPGTPVTPQVGVPVQPVQPAQPLPPVVATPVPPHDPALTAGQKLDDLAGSYYLPGIGGRNDELNIRLDGSFDYLAPEGVKVGGSLARVGSELIFIGAAHQRKFDVRAVPGGLEFLRKETDVLKEADVLGRMPPKGRDAFVWLIKVNAAPAPVPVPPAVPQILPPVVSPVAVPPVAPVPAHVPGAVSGVGGELKALAGTYVHKPSPSLPKRCC